MIRKRGPKEWECALLLFCQAIDSQVQVNVFACSAAISACAKTSNWRQAMSLLEKANEGEKLDSLCEDIKGWDSSVQASKRHGFLDAIWFSIKASLSQKLPIPLLVAKQTKAEQWQSACMIMHQAATFENVNLDAVAYASVVESCDRAAQHHVLLLLLKDLDDSASLCDVVLNPPKDEKMWTGRRNLVGVMFGKDLNFHSGELTNGRRILFNAVLSACAKGRQWQHAIGILQDLDDVRLQPDIVSCSSTISAFGFAEWTKALELLNMALQQALEVDVIAFNAAISAMEGRLGGKEWEVALAILDTMYVHKFQPDVVTVNAAISACDKSEEWQRALELFTSRDGEYSWDVVTFGAVLSACGKGSQWEMALEILAMMPQRQVACGLIACSAAVSACGAAGKWREAIALLEGLSNVDVIIYSSAISACTLVGEWTQALQLLGDMDQRQLLADIFSYNAALLDCTLKKGPSRCNEAAPRISACDKAERWIEALILLESALQQKLPVDVVTFASAMNACKSASAWKQSLALFADLDKWNLKANTVVIGSALGSCAKGTKWPCALQLLASATGHQMQVSSMAYSAAVNACEVGSAWKPALEILAKVLAEDLDLDLIVYGSAMGACSIATQWREVLGLLKDADSLTVGLGQDLHSRALEQTAVVTSLAINACIKQEEVAQGQEEMRREAERLSAGRSPEESKLEKEVEDPDARLDQLLQEQRASAGGEEAEQQDVEDEKSAGGSTELRTPSRPEGRGDQGPLWPGGPTNAPTVNTPLGLGAPLFDEQQLMRMRELEKKAPLLMKRELEVPRAGWMMGEEQQRTIKEPSEEVGGKPSWLEDEEKKRLEEESQREYIKQLQLRCAMLDDEEKLGLLKRVHHLEEVIIQTKSANEKMAEENGKIAKENEDLRRMLRSMVGKQEILKESHEEPPEAERKFFTPEGEKVEGRKLEERLEEEARQESMKKGPESTSQVELMMRMMSSMQKMIEKGEGRREEMGEVESVRTGQIDLPKLPEWNVELGPLEKVEHKPVASEELSAPRWSRLERRATSLLLAALPESQKEEMIATKTLHPLRITSKLMVIYQPGGLSEKGIILRNLESPQEAPTLAAGLAGLRRWLRWKRRAMEVGVALPDATILVRGLNRITKKILENHKELNFRISLAKTTLMVESIPREETVHQLAEHLVAEIEQEPWGKSDLTQDEKKVVREDDTLMWRSLMVYMVSFEMRKLFPGRSGNCEVKLGLEQPADPSHYMPEVVSFWKTEEWRRMKRHYGLQEQTFNQSAWGGKAVKPTTFGGNLLLNLPDNVGEVVGKEEVSSSKELVRWAPGMVKEVAIQLQKQVWGREVKLKPLSWEEHVQRGHTPFRRDCQICQEAAARGRMLKKTSHPRAGILSLDVSGPYVRGNDLESEAKFMLVGAFTALRSSSGGEKVEVSEEVEAGPEMEIQEDEIEEGREVPEVRLEAAEVEGVEDDWEMVGCEEEVVEVEDEEKKVEERQDPEIETLKLGVPLTGKTKEEVLSGIIDLYLKLRMDGYMVHTIHTDQGREFVNRDSKSWMWSRGIIHSTNSGEDPKANGRAERMVGEVKSLVRRALHAAEMDIKWWPMAMRPELEGDQVWIGFLEEADRDEMRVRRRIRGKQPVRMVEGEDRVRLRRLLREESGSLDVDEIDIAHLMFKKLEPLKKMMKKVENEEQEILQTKIVSPQEMVKEIDLWDEAIKSEMRSLLEEKKALKLLTSEEREELEKRHPEIETVPSKLVITRKAGGRRKVRIVACGNFIPKKEEEDLFASGSDAVGVRVALKKAATELWTGASIDIKTAFLNAPLPGGDGENEEDLETTVILRPPPLLVKLGYVKAGDSWMALKAMYGLRQSPKVWGDHRDSILREIVWSQEGKSYWLDQSLAEPNMWKIMKEEEGEDPIQEGFMMIYVDDALILSVEGVVSALIERLGKIWELSKPDWLGDRKPVRFLGVDLWKRKEGGFFVSQEAYIKDLLKRRGEERGRLSGLPITRDQAQKIEEPQKTAPTVAEVRSAQKVSGEVMWLLTRSRPDLMYAMSKMCQNTLKNPLEVMEGSPAVLWGGSLIMWKSGRQPLAPLSTAESELQERIEGMTMGDSRDVLIMEVEKDPYVRTLKMDNMAAVNLIADPSGSWRTRHLPLRASHFRWRIGKLDWMIEAIPGEVQVADIGTKALSAPRLEELKKRMGMGCWKIAEEHPEEEEGGDQENQKHQKGRAQGDQEEERGEVWLLVVFAVGLLSIAIVMVMLGAMLVRISRRGVRSREDEEDSKNQKKENEEKEDASKEEVSREETPSGRSVTFPVQHLEWVNGEWRVTITTDLDDQRRGEEEGRSEKGRS
eukprot:symbB.v1.2.038547.t2/scaffold6043.1/size21519/1